VHFVEARSKEPAEDFVTEVLVGALNARSIVVGDDFHFGHQRRGNVALLSTMGAELGFEVTGVELVGVDGRPAPGPDRVSSTAIRAALVAGDLDRANTMLGRADEVRGLVGHGDKRARELGFSTANVAVPDEICLPADGVYAGWYLRPDGIARPAALSLGRRPTFYEDAQTSLLEAHLLDFEGDLYDEPARVRFVSHLRDELKFESVDALVAQMARDCDEAGTLLDQLEPGAATRDP
jgi:riboflavin kinase/FMN adenylyltransferase